MENLLAASKIEPNQFPTKITVDARELLNAVKAVSNFTKLIDFTVRNGGLFIEATDRQAEGEVDAVIRGANVETFRLNATRLIPFLRRIAGCVTLYPYSQTKTVEFRTRFYYRKPKKFRDHDYRFILLTEVIL